MFKYLLLILIFFSGTSCQNSQTIDSFANSLGVKMVRIEPGTFTMGDLNDQGYYDEKPVHQVTISKPFYISESEITIDQYTEFKKDHKDQEAYKPYVTGISWHEATAFCQWLSEKEGKNYRLPTEAEWEFVSRAGSEMPYSSGVKPPGHEMPNDWDVRNMHTGVLEWCYDWYGPYRDLLGIWQGYSWGLTG